MLINLVHYMVQYTENGLKLILEFKIFDILQKVNPARYATSYSRLFRRL